MKMKYEDQGKKEEHVKKNQVSCFVNNPCFFPSTISDWNRLLPFVIDKITTESFKAGLCNG